MRKEKQLLLDEVSSYYSEPKFAVVLSFSKLAPNTSWDLKEEIKAKGADLRVVKKRLLIKAHQNVSKDVPSELQSAKHIAILFADDENTFGSVLKDFKTWNENEICDVSYGLIDGKKCDSEYIYRLADLPSLDVMRAQFVGLLEAPMSDLLATFNSLLTAVNHCLENKIKKG